MYVLIHVILALTSFGRICYNKSVYVSGVCVCVKERGCVGEYVYNLHVPYILE